MKILSVVIAAALITPAAASFAQSQPVTRAQVKAELVELENVGYYPGSGRPTYPRDVQAAEAKVAAQRAHAGASDDTLATAGQPAAGNAGSSDTHSN